MLHRHYSVELLNARKKRERKPSRAALLERVPVKIRELIRLLETNGWRHARTSGSHRIFRRPDGRTTVVSGKLGNDVRIGTYRAILKDAGLEEAKS
jgi:predicted RNA binding protein YcfA (HicA-like mRNA interferase family)